MTSRVTLRVRLAVRAPFLFPGDANGALGVDAVAARDGAGRAIVPATQIHGVVREAMHDLAAASRIVSTTDLRSLFGDESPEYDDQRGHDQPNRGCLLFSDLTDTAGRRDASELTRVEIDDVTGAARSGHLWIAEQVAPADTLVTFAGHAVLFWNDDPRRIEAIVTALDQAIKLVSAIGAHKSAGFGEMEAAASGIHREGAPEVMGLPSAADADRSWDAAQAAARRDLRSDDLSPDRIGLSLRFDRPYLVNADRVADNAFVGSAVVPGAVIKGALAETLRRIGDGVLREYAEALAKIRISHAFPMDLARDTRGAQVEPLSWVLARDDKKVFRFRDALRVPRSGDANHENPLWDDIPGVFRWDWKAGWDTRTRKAAGWPGRHWPTRLPRTHTMVGDDGAAEDQNLYTTIPLSHEHDGLPGEALSFAFSIDITGVTKAERPRARRLVALLRQGLDGMGRTGAHGTIGDLPEAARMAPVAPVLGHRELFAIVLLTDAVLTDPSATHLTAEAAYDAYWRQVLPMGTLVDFIASQRLAGGYLAFRYRPWPDTYHPFTLTEAGSVFLLRGPIKDELRALVPGGLPLPCFTDAPPLTWQTCPFVPENGFGAFRADHLADGTGLDWKVVPEDE